MTYDKVDMYLLGTPVLMWRISTCFNRGGLFGDMESRIPSGGDTRRTRDCYLSLREKVFRSSASVERLRTS